MTRKLLLLFAILNVSIASAQTFIVNGVNYDIIPTTTNVQVVANSPIYTGAVTIESTVEYNSVTYTVMSIGQQAFYNCTGLTSVTIPDSVISIGDAAFTYCSSLTSVTIPDSVTSIGNSVFGGCSSLTSVTISNSITSIGHTAFGGCSSLTSVTIPNSVTSIGDFAFADCSGLTSVTIPNSVTSIGIFSFQFCTGLTSVTIPNSVTSIGDYAFTNCSNLTTVNCAIVTPLVINANVFGNVNQAGCALNVPVGSEDAYKAAAIWKEFTPINGVLSTESFSNKNKVSVYPNPVSNNLTIEDPFTSSLQLKVINNLGQLVLKQNQYSSSSSLDVSNLSKGLYFLNVAAEDGNSQTIKFIKN